MTTPLDSRYFSVDMPNVVSNNFDGEVIVADYGNGTYYSLVECAADVWLGLQAGRSTREIADALSDLHPTSSQSVQMVLDAFLVELEQCGVIRCVQEPPTRGDWRPTAYQEFIAPAIERYEDLRDLLLLDPVHDAADEGWPAQKS